jgi:Na+/melibiose symporter-like transporter
MVTGVALQLSGFDPNAPQSETALLTLRGVFAAAPFFGFLTGALIFRSFAFNEREYRGVRAELDRRAARRRIDGAG